ncbi:glycosyltransferase [Clostridium perfringens]|uniref:glycosyltransferase n=1 Tax=Clostridium perfringens TaxID=1502 RepID=UPI001BAD556E|nr:glycosyltransferase [Clostridium perfringens]QUD73578.1 glycosyltransferase [Clostridium perfringens]
MKKILIITYSFYPLNSPHAFRMKKLADYWVENGNEVDVLCAWKPGLSRNEVVDNITIYRTGGSIIERIRGGGCKNKNKKGKSGFTNNTKKSLLKFFHDNTWKKVYWPDYAVVWLNSAIRQGKKILKRKKYDKIISVSIPFTSHLVAYKLKRFNNSEWIVDYGDPFSLLVDTPVNNNLIYNKLNYYMENKINTKADKILITPEIEADYLINFKANQEKFKVIPPLLTTSIANMTSENILNKDRINVVFVGTLYKKIRNPKYILQIFNKIFEINNKVDLYFIGNIADCFDEFEEYKNLLGKRIFLTGIVEKSMAEKYINDSSIVLNISNKNRRQLPSKVVEYVSLDKHILNFVSIREDCSVKFFNGYDKNTNIFEWDDISINIEKINEKIIGYKNKKNKGNNEFINRFKVENISKYY